MAACDNSDHATVPSSYCDGWCSVSVFFFSSRRRHTRSLCDWSSDVCSSDLRRRIGLAFVSNRQAVVALFRDLPGQAPAMPVQRMRHAGRRSLDHGATAKGETALTDAVRVRHQREAGEAQFGEAGDPGLARGDQPVVADAICFPPIAEQAAAEEWRDGETRGAAAQSDDVLPRLAHDTPDSRRAR